LRALGGRTPRPKKKVIIGKADPDAQSGLQPSLYLRTARRLAHGGKGETVTTSLSNPEGESTEEMRGKTRQRRGERSIAD